MNLKIILTLLLAAILFGSCSPYAYRPALYHQDIAYQPKPSTFDSVKTSNYISGEYETFLNFSLKDPLESGQVNLNRGYIFKHFNLAYGAFATFGNYQNSSIKPTQANYYHNKYFGAVGGRVSANLLSSDDNTDFRYLGFEAAYSHEFGPFANFRKYLGAQGGYYADIRTDLFTIGLTTEIIVQSPKHKKIQQGFRLFAGVTPGNENLTGSYHNNNNISPAVAPQVFESGYYKFFPKASYFLKVKNYFWTAEYFITGLSLRFGYAF